MRRYHGRAQKKASFTSYSYYHINMFVSDVPTLRGLSTGIEKVRNKRYLDGQAYRLLLHNESEPNERLSCAIGHGTTSLR